MEEASSSRSSPSRSFTKIREALKIPGRDDEAAAALYTVHGERKGNLEVSMYQSYLLG